MGNPVRPPECRETGAMGGRFRSGNATVSPRRRGWSQIASPGKQFAPDPRNTDPRTVPKNMQNNTTSGFLNRPSTSWLRSLAAVALIMVPAIPGLSAAVIDIGSGPNTYHFVLESPNVGLREYAVHLDQANDAYDLLYTVLNEDPAVTANLSNWGTAAQPNYIVNSITYNGVTETNTGVSPWVPSWGHWVSGGQAGWPTASPVPSGTWTNGSGISSPYRLVEPGSWDALVYGDSTTQPSIVPVPEPSMPLLFGAGAGVFILARRRRRSV